MDSQLAIHTIKESCYQVGYPTHDKEHERRKLINQSCDYAIECINKLNKIEQIINEWEEDVPWVTSNAIMHSTLLAVSEVLEQE